MHVLDLSTVTEWRNVGQIWRPGAVSLHCPHCGEKGTFSPREIRE